MLLTDQKVRSAKPTAVAYKISDGAGMYLLVTSRGSRYWRFDYRFLGKRKTLALGVYPAISLASARRLREEARVGLIEGIDPMLRKKQLVRLLPYQDTFEAVARDWLKRQKQRIDARYHALVTARFEGDIFPAIGRLPIDDVGSVELLAMLKKVESRGVSETARRLRQMCGQVFRFAVSNGRAKRDPTPDLRGELSPPRGKKGYRAIPLRELTHFMAALAAYDGDVRTRIALNIQVLTFVRTREQIQARWPEIEDLDGAAPLWRIPAERMKMKTEHLVPLAPQVVDLLRELRSLPGANSSPFLFPSPAKNGHMSNNTMLYAMYRLGYHGRATVHGFRKLASTHLNEAGYAPDLIEKQLAHEERSESRAAYNRALYVKERREMMIYWADVVSGRNVIGILTA